MTLHCTHAMRRLLFVSLLGLAACGGRPHTETARPPQTPDQRLLAEVSAAEALEVEAMHVRQRVRTFLVGLGAVARPPRPEPRPELPGPKPVDDAEWIAGEWIWEATAWVWYEGYWDWVGYVAGDPPRDTWNGDRFRDHRRRGRFRDHRNGRDDTPSPSRTAIRDHRDGDRATWSRDTRDDPPPAKRSEEPTRPTRDREETTGWASSSSSGSTVRDHRDKSESKRDDDGPTIRDHRRK